MKKWNKELWLLTVDEYDKLPDGTRLRCIDNSLAVKGINVDLDTRAGLIAYGLTLQLVQEQNLDHEFLLMILK